jgi:hypothetical protein
MVAVVVVIVMLVLSRMKEIGEEEKAPPTVNGAHTTDDDDDDDDANLEGEVAEAIKYFDKYCTSIANVNFCSCKTHCRLYN